MTERQDWKSVKREMRPNQRNPANTVIDKTRSYHSPFIHQTIPTSLTSLQLFTIEESAVYPTCIIFSRERRKRINKISTTDHGEIEGSK